MAPLYSRYIPSKAVQSQDNDQPGTATADVSQATTVTIQSDSGNGRAKRKRNETDDTDRKAPRYTTSDYGEDKGIGNAVATEAAQIKKSKKKEDGVKKKKTESKAPKAAKSPKRATAAKEDQVMDAVESEVMEGAGNADHEDHLKPAKHTGVFSKFQKAAERSAQIQATAGDAEADGLEEPQPELHGQLLVFVTFGSIDSNNNQISYPYLNHGARPLRNTCQPFLLFPTGWRIP